MTSIVEQQQMLQAAGFARQPDAYPHSQPMTADVCATTECADIIATLENGETWTITVWNWSRYASLVDAYRRLASSIVETQGAAVPNV